MYKPIEYLSFLYKQCTNYLKQSSRILSDEQAGGKKRIWECIEKHLVTKAVSFNVKSNHCRVNSNVFSWYKNGLWSKQNFIFDFWTWYISPLYPKHVTSVPLSPMFQAKNATNTNHEYVSRKFGEDSNIDVLCNLLFPCGFYITSHFEDHALVILIITNWILFFGKTYVP